MCYEDGSASPLKRTQRSLKKQKSTADTIGVLPARRLDAVEARLNLRVKNSIGRLLFDNWQILYSGFAFQRFGKLLKVTKQEREKGKRPKHLEVIDTIRESWLNMAALTGPVHPIIDKIYQGYKKFVSPRSVFESKLWWKNLANYGRNANKWLVETIRPKLEQFLDNRLGALISIDSDPVTFFSNVAWLVRVKSGSVSGYPGFKKQTKEYMYALANKFTVKILLKYMKDRRSINWKKLLFTPSIRTERLGDEGFKNRTVFMAPEFEKPIGAALNYIIKTNLDLFDIPTPMKFGSIDNLMIQIRDAIERSGGLIVCKDYKGYDQSLPLKLLMWMADWAYSKGTFMGYLFAFELDLMINGYLLVNTEGLAFRILSLPSGIGGTQHIGSIIHAFMDFYVGLSDDEAFAVYQSDDTLMVYKGKTGEVARHFKLQEKLFGVKIAPLGTKTFVEEDYGIILQTEFVKDTKTREYVWHRHACRLMGNLHYRESVVGVPDEWKKLYPSYSKQQKRTLIDIIQMLGNVCSLGLNSKFIVPYIQYFYGEGTMKQDMLEEGLKQLPSHSMTVYDMQIHPVGMYHLITNLLEEYDWRPLNMAETARVVDAVKAEMA